MALISKLLYNLGSSFPGLRFGLQVSLRTPHSALHTLSYSTFKRVFGESSLERKCRWWFGISVGLLIFLSFYTYGSFAKKMIYKQNEELGRQLVHEAYVAAHEELLNIRNQPAGALVSGATPEGRNDEYDDIMKAGQRYGRRVRWAAIFPEHDNFKNPPQPGLEERLMDRYSKIVLPPEPESKPATSADEGVSEEEQLPEGAEPYSHLVTIDGKELYRYYYPIYARKSCVACHQVMGDGERSTLKEGELYAIMQISFDNGPTAAKINSGYAILWTAAIITGFLSMFMLWAVVRYVIVKPVKHLRDVSNAVREGEVDQRAEIYTGDEFEELAAAFNRMVRQLLRQRDELTDVNSELDGKVDELAQANLRLYEMNRIKSDFLATMSHELRTPLNSILGFSDVLQDIDSLNDKQKRYVGNIRRSGSLLLDMINDILDLAKMESGRMDVRPTEFRIESIIGSLCDMARPLAEGKNIDIESKFEKDLPMLKQDQAKVQQVLNNLLSNAIKFTPEGGRIIICAMSDPSGMLAVTVEDTGIGISETDQSMVFEKFRQGTSASPGGDAMTREHSGTGLGLSIVRELCRLLGGEVTLSSVVGKGSTFRVTLPWTVEPTSDLDAALKEQVAALHRPHAGDYMTPGNSNGAKSETATKVDAG